MERRWRQRSQVQWKARLIYRGAELEGGLIRDYSADGMCIELPGKALPHGSQVQVVFGASDGDPLPTCVKGLVVHAGDRRIGLLLTTELPRLTQSAAAAA